jgi:tetratricopeptide (TPR) repeat protein
MWTVAHLAGRLAEGQRRLGELVTGDRSVAAAFALSYERLTPDQQRLFRLLGLVPVQDVDAFFAAGVTGTDSGHAGALLEDLVEANLVQPTAAGRYRLHDLMREHATELCHAAESEQQRRDSTGRALDYYLGGCAAAMALVNPRGVRISLEFSGAPPTVPRFADVSVASDWLDTEYPNLVTAIGFAAEHGWHVHAWQVAHVLQWFLRIRGHYAAWVDTNQVALASARTLGDRFAEAEMLKKLGAAYLTLARYDEALEYQNQAVALYREAGDTKGEGDTLNNLGITYKSLDRYDEALHHYQLALAACRATGNRHTEAGSLQNLGNVYLYLSRLDEAADHYRRALAIFTEIGDLRGQVICLTNIGSVEERLGDYDEAVYRNEQALNLLESAGEITLQIDVRINLGSVCCRLGQYQKAIDLQLHALASARDVGDPALQCAALTHLGQTRHAAGQLPEALDMYRQALVLAADIGLLREQARAHDGLGAVNRASDPRAAREHWERAIAIYDQLNLAEADQLRDQLTTVDTVDATIERGLNV